MLEKIIYIQSMQLTKTTNLPTLTPIFHRPPCASGSCLCSLLFCSSCSWEWFTKREFL